VGANGNRHIRPSRFGIDHLGADLLDGTEVNENDSVIPLAAD
jgi:hypothetical protein